MTRFEHDSQNIGTVFSGRYFVLQGVQFIAENDFSDYYSDSSMSNRW